MPFEQDINGKWSYVADDVPLDNSTPEQRKINAFEKNLDRIEYIEDIAESNLRDAKSFIENTAIFVENLSIEKPGEIAPFDVQWITPDYSRRPEVDSQDFDFNIEEFDDVVEFDFDKIEDVFDKFSGFPEEDITEFAFQDVPKPSIGELGVFPTEPVLSGVDIPVAPEYEIPEAPDINFDPIPDMIDVNIPTFDEILVPWNDNVPDSFTWGDTEYSSELWPTLFSKVLENIQNGGTGLSVEVENAIFDAHRNRVFSENEKARNDAENYFAERGFSVPSGILLSKIVEVDRASARDLDNASAEIMRMQAELAQKNTHFFIEKGVELEGLLRKFYIDNINSMIAVQTAIVESSIKVFSARADMARYRLEEYKTKADVWKGVIEGELARVNVFKARIDAYSASVNAKKTLVEIYTSRISALTALIQMYLGQLDAAKTKSEIDRLNVEVYGEKVKAYISKIEASKLAISLYEAELSGEKVKADIYATTVSAYSAKVEAKSRELQALTAAATLYSEKNKMLASEFESKAKAYGERVGAIAKVVGAKADVYRSQISAYSAENIAESSYIEAQIKENEMNLKRELSRMESDLKVEELGVNSMSAIKKLQLDGLNGIMNVSAQLAASAMQGINTSSSISYSGGDSYNQSESSSWSKNYNVQEIIED